VLDRLGAPLGDPLASLSFSCLLPRECGSIELLAQPVELSAALGQRLGAALGVGGPASLLALEDQPLFEQRLVGAQLEVLAELGLVESGLALFEHGRAQAGLEALAELGVVEANTVLLEHGRAQPQLEALAELGLGRTQLDQQRRLGLASPQLLALGIGSRAAGRGGQTREPATTQLRGIPLALALGLRLLMGIEQGVGLRDASTIAEPLLEPGRPLPQATARPHRSHDPTRARPLIATLALSLFLTQLDDPLLLLALAGLPFPFLAPSRSSLSDPAVLGVGLDRKAPLLSLEGRVGLDLAGQLIELATQAVILTQRILELGRQHAPLEQALERRRGLAASFGQQPGELVTQVAARRRVARGRIDRRFGHALLRSRVGRGRLGFGEQVLPAAIANHDQNVGSATSPGSSTLPASGVWLLTVSESAGEALPRS
jgi:hypothetical protein